MEKAIMGAVVDAVEPITESVDALKSDMAKVIKNGNGVCKKDDSLDANSGHTKEPLFRNILPPMELGSKAMENTSDESKKTDGAVESKVDAGDENAVAIISAAQANCVDDMVLADGIEAGIGVFDNEDRDFSPMLRGKDALVKDKKEKKNLQR